MSPRTRPWNTSFTTYKFLLETDSEQGGNACEKKINNGTTKQSMIYPSSNSVLWLGARPPFRVIYHSLAS